MKRLRYLLLILLKNDIQNNIYPDYYKMHFKSLTLEIITGFPAPEVKASAASLPEIWKQEQEQVR